jgi:signal transduction histidine kinase
MASGPAAGLTRLGFRRDVKLFLTLLVGFLIALLLVLLSMLQHFHNLAEEATRQQWNSIADQAVATLDARTDPATLDARMTRLRGRYGIATIVISDRSGRIIAASGDEPVTAESVRRNIANGRLTMEFDPTPLRALHAKFLATAAIVFLSAAIGTGLLILYIGRILRPIETMLGHARELREQDSGVEETHYLIETFRNSIETLKAQEVELRRLHESEKTRADDLARVTGALTRSLTSGFLALETTGRIVDANTAAHEILRVTAPNGRTPAEAFGESEFAEVLQRAFENQVAVTRQEVTHRTAAGDSLTIGLTAIPLKDEHDRLLGMLALFTDLTPTRLLQERLRDAQALADLGQMSAGIAHEFRNSLSTILGYLKLIKRQDPPPEIADRLRAAEEEALELAEAVGTLLQFARPLQLTLDRTELLGLARSVAERVGTVQGVSIDVSGELVQIDADRALLARALENVFRNAIESVRESGRPGRVTVTVGASPEPSVVVEDNGVGLDPADAQRLFLPFLSTKSDGYGLGLPIAKKIVVLHGGTITLRGTPGEGATARIELPSLLH